MLSTWLTTFYIVSNQRSQHSYKTKDFQEQISALLLTFCVAMCKSFNLSEVLGFFFSSMKES